MPEILITGLEMPKEGKILHLAIMSDGRVATESGCDDRFKARGLPPHGPLADLDSNRDEFMNTVYGECSSDGDNYRANRIIDAYDDLPVLIEPTKEAD